MEFKSSHSHVFKNSVFLNVPKIPWKTNLLSSLHFNKITDQRASLFKKDSDTRLKFCEPFKHLSFEFCETFKNLLI